MIINYCVKGARKKGKLMLEFDVLFEDKNATVVPAVGSFLEFEPDDFVVDQVIYSHFAADKECNLMSVFVIMHPGSWVEEGE